VKNTLLTIRKVTLRNLKSVALKVTIRPQKVNLMLIERSLCLEADSSLEIKTKWRMIESYMKTDV